jgi:hypothetical protein
MRVITDLMEVVELLRFHKATHQLEACKIINIHASRLVIFTCACLPLRCFPGPMRIACTFSLLCEGAASQIAAVQRYNTAGRNVRHGIQNLLAGGLAIIFTFLDSKTIERRAYEESGKHVPRHREPRPHRQSCERPFGTRGGSVEKSGQQERIDTEIQ